MKLDTVFQEILTPEFKGFPYGAEPLRLDALGRQGWNLLRGDLPLPVAVLTPFLPPVHKDPLYEAGFKIIVLPLWSDKCR